MLTQTELDKFFPEVGNTVEDNVFTVHSRDLQGGVSVIAETENNKCVMTHYSNGEHSMRWIAKEKSVPVVVKIGNNNKKTGVSTKKPAMTDIEMASFVEKINSSPASDAVALWKNMRSSAKDLAKFNGFDFNGQKMSVVMMKKIVLSVQETVAAKVVKV